MTMCRVSGSRLAILVLALLMLSACTGTRTLKMPVPPTQPSPSGEAINFAVSDARGTTVLGKVDSFTIDAGPSLVEYVEVELTNGLSRMGVATWQGRSNQTVGPKRKSLAASIAAAGLEAKSTLLNPVEAYVKIGIELTDEAGRTTFRRDLRGRTSRELGFHTQGGHEDAALLAEAIADAVAALTSDEAFAIALAASAEEAERSLAAEQAAREAAKAEGIRSIEQLEAAKKREAIEAAGDQTPADPDGCQDHSISSLADDGRLVVLDDGSVWEVDLVDTVDSALWRKGEGVLLCGLRMINTQSGERVSVGPLN
jgi:hypothetical protein